MTDRATSRHRASSSPKTPLSGIGTTLTTAVSDHVGALGRGGVVVAMSSGLVATMGLAPSSASAAAGPDTGTIRTASLPVVPAAASAEASAQLAASSADLLDGTPVVAPAAAKLTFARNSFTAVPKPVVKKAPRPAVKPARVATTHRSTPAATNRDAHRASRAVARAALPTKRKAVADAAAGANGSSVLAIASRYFGIMYVYGGTTPRGFDCSGFTQYVFAQLGVSLPRTADQQMNATRRISRGEARAGDLVFMVSGGRAYHMGIFAGGDMMIDSPRSGKAVSKRKIWSSNLVFTRP